MKNGLARWWSRDGMPLSVTASPCHLSRLGEATVGVAFREKPRRFGDLLACHGRSAFVVGAARSLGGTFVPPRSDACSARSSTARIRSRQGMTRVFGVGSRGFVAEAVRPSPSRLRRATSPPGEATVVDAFEGSRGFSRGRRVSKRKDRGAVFSRGDTPPSKEK